jgi:3-oxoadipate enol-lactonase
LRLTTTDLVRLSLLVAIASVGTATASRSVAAPAQALPCPTPVTETRTYRSGTVPVPGGTLYYELQGSGPDVVLIHGGLVDRRLWDQQFAPLAAQFRVTRYDLAGYGRSTADGKTSRDLVADLVTLLDALKVRRVSLVGLSLGGMIATEFALQHPDRLARLVLVGSGLRGYTPRNAADQERVMSEVRQCGTKACGMEVLLGTPLFSTGMREPCYAQGARRMLDENWAALGTLGTIQWPDRPVVDNLGAIRADTLVIVGGADDPSILEFADVLASRIPRAQKVVFPRVSHHLNMEIPTEFNATVERFVQTGSPAAR